MSPLTGLGVNESIESYKHEVPPGLLNQALSDE
jgi:hypothetical protein